MENRKRLWYPKPQDVLNNNKMVLDIFCASKRDKHEVRNLSKLDPVIREAKKTKGDVETKAAVLMRGINKAHSFSSANKRTAYFTANEFICKNKGYWIAKKRDRQRDMCVKIRESRVTDKEVADWLKYAHKNKVYGKDRWDS